MWSLIHQFGCAYIHSDDPAAVVVADALPVIVVVALTLSVTVAVLDVSDAVLESVAVDVLEGADELELSAGALTSTASTAGAIGVNTRVTS